MTAPDSFHNPFAPPTRQSDVRVATDDSSFTIERYRILCHSNAIELPRVCVRTGDTDDLIIRQQTLKSRPLASNVALVLTFGLILTLLLSGVLGWLFGIASLFAFVVIYAAVTLLTQRRITVTWYVARRYRNRIWLTKLGGFLILTFALGLFASVVWQNATGLITCLSVGAAGGLAFNPERGMKLALLKAGDALVVKGHTLRFYNAVTG